MDKTDLLLAALEHPESLSPEDLEQLLTDPDTAEIYLTITACSTALNGQNKPTDEQIDLEWERFRQTATHRRRPFFFRIGAAATIATAISITALAGMALITVRHFNNQDTPTSGPEPQVLTATTPTANGKALDRPSETRDNIHLGKGAVVFENETLRTVLDRIARHYGAEVVYRSAAAEDLRLYFRWDPLLGLEKTVEDLNNFEQISISLDDNKITVQ